MDKQCFKCKETKDISEFYIHPRMGDGHLGKCKTCTKRDTVERIARVKQNPHWVEQERERCRQKQARLRKDGKAMPSLVSKTRWWKKNRHKKRAHLIAKRAVKNGEIAVKTSCESCGSGGKLHKHHPDYSLPKLVVWLCVKCHGIAHRKPFGSPIQR